MSTPKGWADDLERLQEYSGNGPTIDPTTEGHHEAVGHQRRASHPVDGLDGPPGNWDFQIVDHAIESITCRRCKTKLPNIHGAVLHECP